jgi:hypothetical protein
MQRAGKERPVSFGEPPRKPPVSQTASALGLRIVSDDLPSAKDTAASRDTTNPQRSESDEVLATLIQKRIESRLQGRVRNLHVRATTELVILEGECATFYTKQLAQHAAMGVLNDEHLENAIVVCEAR